MHTLEEDIKLGRSKFRGHSIIWTGKKWVYEDDRSDIPTNGGKIRPCKKCGKLFPLGEGGVDPCLGVLPGVDNACCGHGDPMYAYIRFTNGVVIEGFDVINYTERYKSEDKSIEKFSK